MGNRLSKIYTRTGDDGTTGLADGARVPKFDARVEAAGDVDETNSVIGLLLTEPGLIDAVATPLRRIQHELFEVGAELALPGYRKIDAEHVRRLELELDGLNAALPPLEEFGAARRQSRGGGLSRRAHGMSARRAACLRRGATAPPEPRGAALSEPALGLLFVMARRLAREGGAHEVLWRRET